MTTSQLSLYNAALTRHIGSAALATLTDNTNSRFTLDGIWDSGNFINDVLRAGSWTFATRSQMLNTDPDEAATFGFKFLFPKPADWLRTVMVCDDPYYNSPLTDYNDEAGTWFADCGTIYVKYISNDINFGGDMTLWPEAFTRYAECYLAWQASFTLGQSQTLTDSLEKRMKMLLIEARGRDAMEKPTEMFAMGSWTKARLGGWGGGRRGGGWGGC